MITMIKTILVGLSHLALQYDHIVDIEINFAAIPCEYLLLLPIASMVFSLILAVSLMEEK